MSTKDARCEVALTGDRTTGPLHIGHYVGSLKNRVSLQHTYRQYILLADSQALTDHISDPGRVRESILEIALDYLAAGINPDLTTICVQSCLPSLAQLTVFYLNLVTIARLERNPTVKAEIGLRNFARTIPAGFLCYPVAQAADITAFKANVVPVGDDQLPMIEQSNEIVRSINQRVGRDVLPEAQALLTNTPRLPGFDGKSKMSKSNGNVIPLSASKEDIKNAVRKMYTDPNHIRVSDPGRIEGNVVFQYLDAFYEEQHELADLKRQYAKGGVADSHVKAILSSTLENVIAPMRERRHVFACDKAYVYDVIRKGTALAKHITEETYQELMTAFGLSVSELREARRAG